MIPPACHIRAIDRAASRQSRKPRARKFRARDARAGGLMLMEALIASVVLSVAVVGIVGALDASYVQSSYLRQNATAVSLAKQLLDEMAAKPSFPYAANAGVGVTQRSLIGSAGDYDGYTDSTAAMKTQGGVACSLGGGETYQRSVKITPYSRPLGDPSSPTDEGDFLLATVTVTEPCGAAVSLSRTFVNLSLVR